MGWDAACDERGKKASGGAEEQEWYCVTVSTPLSIAT